MSLWLVGLEHSQLFFRFVQPSQDFSSPHSQFLCGIVHLCDTVWIVFYWFNRREHFVFLDRIPGHTDDARYVDDFADVSLINEDFLTFDIYVRSQEHRLIDNAIVLPAP